MMKYFKHSVNLLLALSLLFSSAMHAQTVVIGEGEIILRVDKDDKPGDTLGSNQGNSDDGPLGVPGEADSDGVYDGDDDGDQADNGHPHHGHGDKGKPSKSDKEETAEEKFQRIMAESNRDIEIRTSSLVNDLNKSLGSLNEDMLGNANITQSEEPVLSGVAETFDAIANIESGSSDNFLLEQMTEISLLSQATYTSHKKDELEAVKRTLLSKPTTTPQQSNAKIAGLQSLKYSDLAYNADNEAQGDFYFEAAKQLASIVADFIPAASVAKDVYGLFVGKDLFTGEKLSATERALSGMFAVAQVAGSFYTAGAGAPFIAAAIKEVRVIAKADERAIKLAGSLAKFTKKTGNRPVVALEGASKKITVVGRSMESVKETEAALKNDGFMVEIFDDIGDGSVISKAARLEFEAVKKQFAPVLVPNDKLMKLKIRKENKAWIDKAIKDGHTVIDTGNANGTFSVFYTTETAAIREAQLAGAK